METKTLFFYISLAVLLFRFSPFDNISIMPGVGIIYTISGIYIIIFSLHMLIKNLKEVKHQLTAVSLTLTNKLVLKNDNPIKDVIKFLLLSLLIALSIDIILTKVSDKPLWEFASYVPGIDPILDFIDLNETATQISDTANRLLSPTDNGFDTTSPGRSRSQPKDETLTTQQIKPFIDTAVGAFILFLLRQFVYRNRHIEQSEIPKNPGSRVLLLFLIATAIIFVLDIIQDASQDFATLKNNQDINQIDARSPVIQIIIFDTFNRTIMQTYPAPESNSNATESSDNGNNTQSLYGLYGIIIFLAKLTNPFVYLTIISVWAFDWYLFSRIWVHYKL